jgi:ribulose-phosphate 3-epimerase
VDGGVNLDNAGRIAAAGADMLVAGSAVFGAPDADGGYRRILAELRAETGECLAA